MLFEVNGLALLTRLNKILQGVPAGCPLHLSTFADSTEIIWWYQAALGEYDRAQRLFSFTCGVSESDAVVFPDASGLTAIVSDLLAQYQRAGDSSQKMKCQLLRSASDRSRRMFAMDTRSVAGDACSDVVGDPFVLTEHTLGDESIFSDESILAVPVRLSPELLGYVYTELKNKDAMWPEARRVAELCKEEFDPMLARRARNPSSENMNLMSPPSPPAPNAPPSPPTASAPASNPPPPPPPPAPPVSAPVPPATAPTMSSAPVAGVVLAPPPKKPARSDKERHAPAVAAEETAKGRICVACSGKGKNSRGGECASCNGTGLERESTAAVSPMTPPPPPPNDELAGLERTPPATAPAENANRAEPAVSPNAPNTEIDPMARRKAAAVPETPASAPAAPAPETPEAGADGARHKRRTAAEKERDEIDAAVQLLTAKGYTCAAGVSADQKPPVTPAEKAAALRGMFTQLMGALERTAAITQGCQELTEQLETETVGLVPGKELAAVKELLQKMGL